MITIRPGVEVTPEDLYLSMANIWFETLKLHVLRADAPEAAAGPGEELQSGHVKIIGAWTGALVIEAPAGLLRLAASRMLDCAPSQVTQGDILDTVGELTNIVAGNIKIDFPGACRLTFPQVSERSGYSSVLAGSRLFCDVFLLCERFRVHVALFEQI
jgi:CheY-specific phosphatase CheX